MLVDVDGGVGSLSRPRRISDPSTSRLLYVEIYLSDTPGRHFESFGRFLGLLWWRFGYLKFDVPYLSVPTFFSDCPFYLCQDDSRFLFVSLVSELLSTGLGSLTQEVRLRGYAPCPFHELRVVFSWRVFTLDLETDFPYVISGTFYPLIQLFSIPISFWRSLHNPVFLVGGGSRPSLLSRPERERCRCKLRWRLRIRSLSHVARDV